MSHELKKFLLKVGLCLPEECTGCRTKLLPPCFGLFLSLLGNGNKIFNSPFQAASKTVFDFFPRYLLGRVMSTKAFNFHFPNQYVLSAICNILFLDRVEGRS